MNKFGGLVMLGFVAGWGASRFMGSRSYDLEEKMKAKAEQIKGRVEQSVGKATGSEETQARGEVDEAKGIIREKVADLKADIKGTLEEATA